MSIACPQCGRPAPDGVVVGATYACSGCGNPVLAAEPEAAPVAAAPAASSTPRAPGAPWRLAALALAVLAAAHAGLFALLTAEARRERGKILELEPSVLEAPDPGPPPLAEDAKAWREWNPKKSLFDDRLRVESLSTRIDTMGTWLAGAYAAQAALVAFVLVKGSRKAESSQRARARSPARTPAR